MKITIIAVGKIKECYLKIAEQHYLTLISKRIRLDLIEGADESEPVNIGDKLIKTAKSGEARRIMSVIPKGAKVVLLDIKGSNINVYECIKKNIYKDTAYIIVGSNGFG